METKLPETFLNRMKDMLGSEYDTFLASYDEPSVKSLRLNTRRIKPVDIAHMSRISTGEKNPESVQWCPFAFYYRDHEAGKTSLHAAGAYYIQEASAMLPVTYLDADDPGMKVLDLCAAPGGKTTQIADCMNGHGLLVANEIIKSRAKILSENVERLGVCNALVLNEEPDVLADRFPLFFDRILVDAPCSGEGMFRKSPEAVEQWSPDNVKMCAMRQDFLLDCASSMLSEGGRIVYSTCTFAPDEDEGCAERFLLRHPEFKICDGPHRLYPHREKGEGHFAVSFVRKSEEGSKAVIPERKKHPAGAGKNTGLSLFYDFLGETLTKDCVIRKTAEEDPGRLLKFGDALYLAPEFMPDIKGLKVERAGLKLGTFLKNRFEPNHALSHALSARDVYRSIDTSADDDVIRRYLAGMTIDCDPDMKGWCLVCTEGLSAGWGKAVSGTVRNHYPKGLRTASV